MNTPGSHPANNDYLSLIKQDQFAEAAKILQVELKITPDDGKKRALVYCFTKLDQIPSAIEIAKQIEKPVVNDYIRLAVCYWTLLSWDEMSNALKAALKIEPSAAVYYYLARAESRDKYDYELDDATEEIIIGYLSKAISFDDCAVESYLWLARLYGRGTVEKRIEVLQQALKKFPENKAARSELVTTYLYWKNDARQAFEILQLLLKPDTIDDLTRWYAFEAMMALSNYEKAALYFNEIAFSDTREKAQIRADIFFHEGKLSDWLVALEELDDGSTAEIVKKLFRKAYVNLKKDNLNQAIRDFKEGFDWIVKAEDTIEYWLYPSIQSTHVEYKLFDPIRDVCEHLLLLYGESLYITDEILGRIVYIFSEYGLYQNDGDEIQKLLPRKSEDMLLTSAELMGYPPILAGDLCCYYVSEDLPKAVDYHLIFSLWSYENDVEWDMESLEYCYHNDEITFEEQFEKQYLEIREIVLKHFKLYPDEPLEEIFFPFYERYLREILFRKKQFQTVVDMNRRFVEITDGREGLFDLAYALNELGQIDEAKAVYERLIGLEPNNTSALNNLAVIHEKRGSVVEAQTLFAKATQLNKSEKLYSSNLERVTKRIDQRKIYEQQAKEAVEVIKQKALGLGITPEQQVEISDLFWNSDITLKSLQARYNQNQISKVIIPLSTGEKCPNCFLELVYKNRTARNADERVCLGCGHQSRGWCSCEHCKRLEEEKRRKAEEKRLQTAQEEFKRVQEQYCTTDYVQWAINKLSRKQKEFLRAFIEVIKDKSDATWQDICEKASVVSEKTYLKTLQNLKLLLTKPEGGVICNSAVTLDMLEVPNVRHISKSLRFDVFQRDNHTCQYCGRTPPDVVLVIDHLNPVAQNGTDDFDNLITSCRECNEGKSDKLIQNFTGGFSKEEWRKHLRDRRVEILHQRQQRLEEVIQHWQKTLGHSYLKQSDNEAIYTFIESYEPDWIKAAIEISVRKKVDDYIKYTAVILRNWAKDGPPTYISNPDTHLSSKQASPKQLEYIHSLLEQLDLRLEEFYPKHDFNQLTMLDARNLIRALTEKLEE